MFAIRKITFGMKKKFIFFTILTPLLMLGEVFLETVIPYLMSLIIDKGIQSRDTSCVIQIGITMLLCALVSLCFGAGGALTAACASQGFSRALRQNLFSKIQSFAFVNIDKFSSASLITRLTTDVTNLQNVYQLLIRICFRSPFMLISGTAMAFVINARLAVIFLVAIPVLGSVIAIVSAAAYSRFAKMLKKYDRLNSVVQENLIAIRIVKAFGRGEYECEKFEEAAEAVKNAQVRAEKLVIILMPVMQTVVYSSIISIFWFGGKMTVSGSLQPGELVSFLTYVSQIFMSLMMLGMVFVSVILSRASMNRVVEVLDEKPFINESAENLVEEIRDGSIEFENVSFSYTGQKDNNVLADISFHIESGESIGIIGGTGSSKSTLISLIPRLYDVSKGSVKVSGVDVKNYSIAALRKEIAVVPQKNILFSGTIRENLLWGNDTASEQELVSACEASNADSFINTFTSQYDTVLEPGGTNLSGGQKQRLCIARALLKDSKILILDDSLSAVDTATEASILKNLFKFKPEMTKIIIAHRISAVQNADRIIVLDEGRISGIGSHSELLQSCAVYKELYDSQKSICLEG